MTEDKKQQSADVTENEVVQAALQAAKPVRSDNLPLVNDKGQKLSRRFLGDIFGRGQDKKEFETYLKGGSTFKWKKSTVTVRQEYFYV